MSTDRPLVNRVAASGLITLDLADYLPNVEIATFDLKDYLFRELILREKDFRAALAEHDWQGYAGKTLLVYCSTDAIIPMWAYMLIAAYATPHAEDIFQGTPTEYYHQHLLRRLGELDPTEFAGRRVVVKGCGDQPVPAAAYLELTRRLQPVVKSLMYGEPCSTVPIYKQPK